MRPCVKKSFRSQNKNNATTVALFENQEQNETKEIIIMKNKIEKKNYKYMNEWENKNHST